jgi:glycosyltransferase involved in cell wall biosynthesis
VTRGGSAGPAEGARPRVVLASRIFAPESAAATFRLTALVRALVERGAQVEVLTATPPRGTRVEDGHDVPGAVVRRWPVLRDAAGYVRGYLPYLSFDVPLKLRLWAVSRPDIVVVEPPPTTGAMVRATLATQRLLLRRETPYVYYAADIWSDASASTGAPGVVVTVLRALERFAISGAREVIAVSDGVAERVHALGGARVHVVPNGIDTQTFSPDGPVAAEAPRDTAYLVYAGTASEWQGAEIFAEAMRLVVQQEPEARLVFLGQGSAWPALRRIAWELPDGAVQLRPLVPPAQAAAWQRGAAGAVVSVRPGLDYDFAYPTKVIAALACGTPVVYAGPGPAADDITQHDLGRAVPYEVSPVAEAMLEVLRTPRTAEDEHRRVSWVLEHRSVSATGRAAADVVLGGAATLR